MGVTLNFGYDPMLPRHGADQTGTLSGLPARAVCLSALRCQPNLITDVERIFSPHK